MAIWSRSLCVWGFCNDYSLRNWLMKIKARAPNDRVLLPMVVITSRIGFKWHARIQVMPIKILDPITKIPRGEIVEELPSLTSLAEFK